MNLRAELRLAARCIRALPPRVAWFLLRARVRALRTGDRFSIDAAARPEKLAALLAAARGRRQVVELGTGTAWAALALALDDPQRRVVSFDPIDRDRQRYFQLLPPAVGERVTLVAAPGEVGPRDGDPPVDLLFIDSSHDREPTVAEYRAWQAALAAGATVVFDDYGHPAYPGVAEAVEDLGLRGRVVRDLYVVTL